MAVSGGMQQSRLSSWFCGAYFFRLILHVSKRRNNIPYLLQDICSIYGRLAPKLKTSYTVLVATRLLFSCFGQAYGSLFAT